MIFTLSHTRWKLDWNNTTSDLLGIKFSINLDDMSELNYTPKLLEINKIMNQWKHRKLTPIGRFKAIKSLIIPKLNHLILNLPNPDTNSIKKLENDLFHFYGDATCIK